MDDSRLTRPYLETLSSDELVRLADRHGIDIPFDLERTFIIAELLDLAREDAAEPADPADPKDPKEPVCAGFTEAAVLPSQYNISFIEVMIRDPLWAFVFWEIKSHDRNVYEQAADFEGYCLRAIPIAAAPEHIFTVPVGVNDSAWYLGFPAEESRRSYRIELCVLREAETTALAVSRPFSLPALFEPSGGSEGLQAAYSNPLALLSGVHDFSLVRSVNRRSRFRGV
jgi:hypothetical protein